MVCFCDMCCVICVCICDDENIGILDVLNENQRFKSFFIIENEFIMIHEMIGIDRYVYEICNLNETKLKHRMNDHRPIVVSKKLTSTMDQSSMKLKYSFDYQRNVLLSSFVDEWISQNVYFCENRSSLCRSYIMNHNIIRIKRKSNQSKGKITYCSQKIKYITNIKVINNPNAFEMNIKVNTNDTKYISEFNICFNIKYKTQCMILNYMDKSLSFTNISTYLFQYTINDEYNLRIIYVDSILQIYLDDGIILFSVPINEDNAPIISISNPFICYNNASTINNMDNDNNIEISWNLYELYYNDYKSINYFSITNNNTSTTTLKPKASLSDEVGPISLLLGAIIIIIIIILYSCRVKYEHYIESQRQHGFVNMG